MLTTVRRSRPKGPLRAVPGATNNRKIGGRLCYCDSYLAVLPQLICVNPLFDRYFKAKLHIIGAYLPNSLICTIDQLFST